MTKCVDCGQSLSLSAKYSGAKRCKKHASIHRMLHINYKGKNNPNYTHGESLKKHCCIVCKRKIHWQTAITGSGMCRSCSTKSRYKNKHGSRWQGGKPHCKNCGKKIWYGRIRCKSCNTKNRHATGSLNNRGVLNGNYITGEGWFPYTKEFTLNLKRTIRRRDSYKCQNCDMTEEEHLMTYGKNLDIHHIDYCGYNCTPKNLISLCRKCNIQANYSRDYWFAYYTYIIEEFKKFNQIIKAGTK